VGGSRGSGCDKLGVNVFLMSCKLDRLFSGFSIAVKRSRLQKSGVNCKLDHFVVVIFFHCNETHHLTDRADFTPSIWKVRQFCCYQIFFCFNETV